MVSGDLVKGVAKLKDEVDGDISVPGSITLVQGWVEHDLVDEIRLMTFPVVVGMGRKLFTETTDRSAWRLTEVTTYGDGVLVTIYRRAD